MKEFFILNKALYIYSVTRIIELTLEKLKDIRLYETQMIVDGYELAKRLLINVKTREERFLFVIPRVLKTI